MELRAEKAVKTIASSVVMLSAATAIQARTRVWVRTIHNAGTKLRTNFQGKEFMVIEVGYLTEPVMPRLDVRSSTLSA